MFDLVFDWRPWLAILVLAGGPFVVLAGGGWIIPPSAGAYGVGYGLTKSE